MKKEEFLALAEQVFDQINPQGEESKISIDKNLFDEIVDQVGSEINDLGRDIVDDYQLEMYSNEVTLESIEVDYKEIERSIKNVLERYFEIK